jgi:hypothetical protein
MGNCFVRRVEQHTCADVDLTPPAMGVEEHHRYEISAGRLKLSGLDGKGMSSVWLAEFCRHFRPLVIFEES